MHVRITVRKRPDRICKRDEVGRNQPGALMKQLEEGVLSVRSRFTPEHFPGVIRNWRAVPPHPLTIRFHGHLLQVGREAMQVLGVGQHHVGRSVEEIHVPDVQ